jgi:hypothetical protein
MNSRRSFFQDFAALSAVAAMAEERGLTQPQGLQEKNFWNAYFAEATRDPTKVSRGSNDNNLIDPAKKVELIQATKDGLRYPDGIADSDLLSDTDVAITVNPGHFRPGPDDHRAIGRSKGAQIRLDWIQSHPIMNLLAPMAWSALAAWSLDKTNYSYSQATDPKTGAKEVKNGQPVMVAKLNAGPAPPDLKDLDFRDPNDPSAPEHNQVILMGGSGRMALNARAVSTNQRLKTILDSSVTYSSMVAPFFGFAPLAIPALKAFTAILSALFNHEAVIMNSLPLQILATQGSVKGPHDTNSVKIVSGSFIAVPSNQTALLKDSLGKLMVEDDWLVHQDSKPNVPVQQRALDPLVPPVSYISMRFTVQSLEDAKKDKAKG